MLPTQEDEMRQEGDTAGREVAQMPAADRGSLGALLQQDRRSADAERDRRLGDQPAAAEPRVSEEAYRQAVQQGQASVTVHRGCRLEREGDLDGAEAAFQAADRCGDAVAAFNLGVLLERRGDLVAAETAYRRADERGSAAAACVLGCRLEDAGDLAGAAAAYRRADERGSAAAAFNLGLLLERHGAGAGAQAAYGRAAAGRDLMIAQPARKALVRLEADAPRAAPGNAISRMAAPAGDRRGGIGRPGASDVHDGRRPGRGAQAGSASGHRSQRRRGADRKAAGWIARRKPLAATALGIIALVAAAFAELNPHSQSGPSRRALDVSGVQTAASAVTPAIRHRRPQRRAVQRAERSPVSKPKRAAKPKVNRSRATATANPVARRSTTAVAIRRTADAVSGNRATHGGSGSTAGAESGARSNDNGGADNSAGAGRPYNRSGGPIVHAGPSEGGSGASARNSAPTKTSTGAASSGTGTTGVIINGGG